MVQELAPPPDGRRTRHEGRRDAVLDAVVGHVLVHGWSGTSLRSVAEAIGLSHRALLYHFRTKADLLRAVVVEVRRREQAHLAGAADDATDVVALLRRAWTRVSTAEHLPYVRLHLEFQVLAMTDPQQADVLGDLVGTWTDLLAELLVRRGVDRAAAGGIATWVYAGVRGLQLDLLATGDRARVDAAADDLARTLAGRIAAAGADTGRTRRRD